MKPLKIILGLIYKYIKKQALTFIFDPDPDPDPDPDLCCAVAVVVVVAPDCDPGH